jgi:hypothetical protein
LDCNFGCEKFDFEADGVDQSVIPCPAFSHKETEQFHLSFSTLVRRSFTSLAQALSTQQGALHLSG